MKQKLNCVLLIDDDDATNFINRKVIENADVAERIVTALNGKEAIEFLTNSGSHEKEPGCPYPQPMLILLDINMPIMDGWEFLSAYQQLDASQKCKVIIVMLTSSLNPDDESRAGQFPEISWFKHKPLSEEMLDEIMKSNFPECA